MPVPIELQPRAIQKAFEMFTSVETSLAKYFPMTPSPNPGTHVTYEVVQFSQERPEVNTRDGEPIYTTPPVVKVVDFEGETWRDGARISPQTLKDIREPGSATQNRGRAEIARRTRALRLRYERFLEWLRAEALQGVKTYKPRGSDTEFSELLLCSDDCITDYNVTGAWDDGFDDGPTAAEALVNMQAIYQDFAAAKTAIGNAGCVCDTVIMNTTTRGYIDVNAQTAGIRELERQIYAGGITELYGLKLDIVDGTYIHPISGAVTNYIPDDVVIFLDSNNVRAGRAMVECEALHVEAPPGTMGLYFHSYNIQEAPGEIRISGEWTGGPEVAVNCSQYVMTDVTAGAEQA